VKDGGELAMSDDGGVPATKELAKVANNLVNKISKAVGVLYEPTHIKRIAKAKAEAAVTEAEGKLQVTHLQRRAFNRWLQEEERNQRNMEAVTQLAIEHLKPDAKPEQINDDWLVDLFEKVKKVSDADMQKLWAKVLAGEANSSGSFSKATLHTLSVLQAEDAKSFAALARFTVVLGQTAVMPAVFSHSERLYIDNGVNYGLMLHLESMGLVRLVTLGEFNFTVGGDRQVSYHGWSYLLGPDVTSMDMGHVMYTLVGAQLLKLCESELVPGFSEYLVERIEKRGGAAGKEKDPKSTTE
jgi:hypothetical protein